MWPIERREELAELESLVADCAKLNHTTRAIEMLARITERAVDPGRHQDGRRRFRAGKG